MLLAWGAANRDPRQYDDPDVFRADRNPTGHLAFGSGIHSCPGTRLARMEGQAVLREIVDNIDRIDVVEAADVDDERRPSRPHPATGSPLRAAQPRRACPTCLMTASLRRLDFPGGVSGRRRCGSVAASRPGRAC